MGSHRLSFCNALWVQSWLCTVMKHYEYTNQSHMPQPVCYMHTLALKIQTEKCFRLIRAYQWDTELLWPLKPCEGHCTTLFQGGPQANQNECIVLTMTSVMIWGSMSAKGDIYRWHHECLWMYHNTVWLQKGIFLGYSSLAEEEYPSMVAIHSTLPKSRKSFEKAWSLTWIQ